MLSDQLRLLGDAFARVTVAEMATEAGRAELADILANEIAVGLQRTADAVRDMEDAFAGTTVVDLRDIFARERRAALHVIDGGRS